MTNNNIQDIVSVRIGINYVAMFILELVICIHIRYLTETLQTIQS